VVTARVEMVGGVGELMGEVLRTPAPVTTDGLEKIVLLVLEILIPVL